MSLTVVTDPFDPNCNSYVSVADMDSYVSDRVVDSSVKTAWDALTDAHQATYLVNATRTLDSLVQWIGDRYSRDQRLDWPRVNAYYDGFLLDQISFPIRVKEATCEMAIWAMQNNGVVSVIQQSAYDSIKVGPITVDFNEGSGISTNQYFPDNVALLLDGFGTVQNPNLPGQHVMKTVRLERA